MVDNLKEKGFTIFELLAVMFIISLLASVVLANYRTGQRNYSLSQATQKLISDLRYIQNSAMSGSGISGQYCGYGIYIDTNNAPSSYVIYGDVSGDCDSTNNQYGGEDSIIETINFPSRVLFQSTSPDPIDIFFKPPHPTTYINGSSANGLTGDIVTMLQGGSTVRNIIVNTAGLIQ